MWMKSAADETTAMRLLKRIEHFLSCRRMGRIASLFQFKSQARAEQVGLLIRLSKQ
jgi:hypothetical protein